MKAASPIRPISTPGCACRLAGILAARVWVEVERLLPGQRVEIESPLVALSSGDLIVFVEYAGRDGRQWSTSQSYPITVTPSPLQVDIEGSVGWLDLRGLEGKIRVHGDVGLVKKSVDRAEESG